MEAVSDAGWRPAVVMAEFNINFPPPMRFNLPLTPPTTYHWGLFVTDQSREHKGDKVGPQLSNQCSLQHFVEMMDAHGYQIIQVDWWDVYFVRADVVDVVTGGAVCCVQC